MNDIEKLMAIENIRQVKSAYFRCMDTKAWQELAGLFTETALFDVRGALEMPKTDAEYAKEPVIVGRAAIVDYIRTGLTPLISVHHGHLGEVEITSATTAKACWPMTDILVPPAGGPFKRFTGHGYYRETYAREGSVWRIATLQLRRLYVEMQQ
jgi:hypothetical protein